jgi:hypothetical protein
MPGDNRPALYFTAEYCSNAYLKEVVPIRPIQLAAQHAAPFEISSETHRGRDHFGRVSR